MHRLFVAIRPPLEIRSRLLSLMGGVAGARWQSDAQLHITLRFVGEVDGRRAEDLLDALRTVHFEPFAIELNGLGTFERKGRSQTLWAGLQPRDGLLRLHQKVDRVCVMAGLPPAERSYLPHITLARLKSSAVVSEGFLAVHAGLSSAPFLVERFTLFESHLGSEGATYHVVSCYEASR